ncbi:MAG: D-alanyl-D-alanine carboxypeptidase [Clostridia bacterium]|nr:D-alanyl-D-alanine carboxypeptidase [Clostridia bacterium]
MSIPVYSFGHDSTSSYIWSTDIDSIAVNSSDILETNSEIENNNSLNLESGSAILIEQSTGQVLYSHNAHEQLCPASVTKIMSILLIMEQIDNGSLSYSDTISCSETARSMGGSQIWLDPRETLTVDEMLKAICVVSANDCNVQKRQENEICEHSTEIECSLFAGNNFRWFFFKFIIYMNIIFIHFYFINQFTYVFIR